MFASTFGIPYKGAVVLYPKHKFHYEDTQNSTVETEFGFRLLLQETGDLCDCETVKINLLKTKRNLLYKESVRTAL